jgi:hypothetical protein
MPRTQRSPYNAPQSAQDIEQAAQVVADPWQHALPVKLRGQKLNGIASAADHCGITHGKS